MTPLEAADGTFMWFRKDGEEPNTGSQPHWLSPILFNRLKGGTLLVLMGIRVYASETAAMEAVRC